MCGVHAKSCVVCTQTLCGVYAVSCGVYAVLCGVYPVLLSAHAHLCHVCMHIFLMCVCTLPWCVYAHLHRVCMQFCVTCACTFSWWAITGIQGNQSTYRLRWYVLTWALLHTHHPQFFLVCNGARWRAMRIKRKWMLAWTDCWGQFPQQEGLQQQARLQLPLLRSVWTIIYSERSPLFVEGTIQE